MSAKSLWTDDRNQPRRCPQCDCRLAPGLQGNAVCRKCGHGIHTSDNSPPNSDNAPSSW